MLQIGAIKALLFINVTIQSIQSGINDMLIVSMINCILYFKKSYESGISPYQHCGTLFDSGNKNQSIESISDYY